MRGSGWRGGGKSPRARKKAPSEHRHVLRSYTHPPNRTLRMESKPMVLKSGGIVCVRVMTGGARKDGIGVERGGLQQK